MNANLIISTEYHLNTPSVFIFVDGQYYGCKIYPSRENFPSNIEHWKTITCADSDRYFSVTDIQIDEPTMANIKKLQNAIEANNAMLIHTNYPVIKKTWNVKRGKAYQAYKEATDLQMEQIKKDSSYNSPFQAARSIAFNQLRALLLSLKK